MAWYNAGTVAVTNNNTTVTGSGTNWTQYVDAGQGFNGPDGLTYEIAAVVSATQLTLARAYRGTTAAGQAYSIEPVQGYTRDFALAAADLVLSFATVRDNAGQGIFGAGSAGTPGVRFSGDEDTGLYRIGANILGIATNGTERVRVNSTGLVSIGTNNEKTRLNVAGPDGGVIAPTLGVTSGTLFLSCNDNSFGLLGGAYDGSGHFWLQVQRTDGTGTAYNLNLQPSGGNVGIGTNSPSWKLTVAGSGSDLATILSSSTSSGLLMGDSVGTIRLGTRSGAFIVDVGIERMRVATSGNVGIGSNSLSPAAPLDITTGAGRVFISAASVNDNAIMSVNAANNASRDLRLSGAAIKPDSDGAQTLGAASFRWATIYSTVSVINTSDEREKLWIGIREDRRAKDRRIAAAILDQVGYYQLLDSVAEKGEDGARWHFGAKAQAVWSIVAAEGLCAPLVGEGAEQQPDPDWQGAPPPAWLCWDVWEDRYRPIMEERQVDTKSIKVGEKDTGVLDAAGRPIMRDVFAELPVMGMVQVGEELEKAAGNRFGLRLDQIALLLAWAQYEREKNTNATIAALSSRIAQLEAA